MVTKQQHKTAYPCLNYRDKLFVFILLCLGIWGLPQASHAQSEALRFEVQLAKYNPQLKQGLFSFSINRASKEKVILFLSNEGNVLMKKGRKSFYAYEADTLLNDTLYLSFSPNPRFEKGRNGVEISYAVGQELKLKKKEWVIQFTVDGLEKRPLFTAIWLQYYIGKAYEEEAKRMFIFPVR